MDATNNANADFSDQSLRLELVMSPSHPASTGALAFPAPATSNSGSSMSEADGSMVTRRRPIPKKGHTKSRRGCQSCKRRKVKCQETIPECANCKRLGLTCEYLGTRYSASSSNSTPSPSVALQTTPGTFTMADLRFFHHFLVTAYPPLPMGGAEVWKGVAALSHDYEYLVHAMLGLAASHLDLYTGNCAKQALAHRVKAMELLNRSLSNPCTSPAEGDARFGAIMALTFQASCMRDGMGEFLTMTRGCSIVAASSIIDFRHSLFREFTQEGYSESVWRAVNSQKRVPNALQQALIDDFQVAIRRLAPFCSSPLELRFLASTERATKMMQSSPVLGRYPKP